MALRGAMLAACLAGSMLGCGSTVAEVVVVPPAPDTGDASIETETSPSEVGIDAHLDHETPPDGPHDIVIKHPGDTVCTTTAAVTITVADWTLADPGTCAGKPACGHAYVTLDGPDCNAAGKPYNAVIGASGSADADSSLCKKGPTGPKLLGVELRRDDGTPLSPGAHAVKSVDFRACP